jgi:hypothetical protein
MSVLSNGGFDNLPRFSGSLYGCLEGRRGDYQTLETVYGITE